MKRLAVAATLLIALACSQQSTETVEVQKKDRQRAQVRDEKLAAKTETPRTRYVAARIQKVSGGLSRKGAWR